MKKPLLFFLFFLSGFLLYAQCNNVTDGGVIGYDEVHCGPFDPAPIVNVQSPSGGSGQLEYMWIATYNPNSYGPSNAIPGANGITYDPPMITQTTWYVRCTRRAGCSDWLGESIVKKEVSDLTVDLEVTHLACTYSGTGVIDVNIYSGSPPFTIIMNGNQASSTMSGLNPGWYHFIVTDGAGCFWSDSAEVLDNNLDLSIQQYDDPCSQDNDWAEAIVTGGFGPFTYWWSNGETGPVLDGNGIGLDGTYTVYVNDSLGCQFSETVYFESGDESKAEILCCQDTVICEGGMAEVLVEFDGVGPWILNWDECGTLYTDTAYSSPYTIVTSPSSTCAIELISVNTSCGSGELCGKATVAVQDCDPSSCLSGCFYSSVDYINEVNGCLYYSLYITSTGCNTELSNAVISIPCGTVSNLYNDYGFDMYYQSEDPNSGLSGIKIDNISNFYPGSYMTVSFKVCPDGCDLVPQCLPIVSYKAGNCVVYEETIPQASIYSFYSGDIDLKASPNPFEDKTVIEIKHGNFHPLNGLGYVLITDLSGRPIKRFEFNAISPAGDIFEWDGTDEYGKPVQNGTYILYYNAEGIHRIEGIRIVKT